MVINKSYPKERKNPKGSKHACRTWGELRGGLWHWRRTSPRECLILEGNWLLVRSSIGSLKAFCWNSTFYSVKRDFGRMLSHFKKLVVKTPHFTVWSTFYGVKRDFGLMFFFTYAHVFVLKLQMLRLTFKSKTSRDIFTLYGGISSHASDFTKALVEEQLPLCTTMIEIG